MRRMSQLLSFFLSASLQLHGASALPQGLRSTSPVVGLLNTAPDARTRAQAALTLGRLRPAGTREALENGLNDRSAAVRAACAAVLGDLGDPVSLAPLRARANDPDANVREAISRSLSRLSPQSPPDGPDTLVERDPSSIDFRAVRYILRPQDLSDRTGQNPEHVIAVRTAVFSALSDNSTIAALSAPPPRSALRSIHRGTIRQFSLEGGLQRLQRSQLSGTDTLRAEVSLVIVSPRNHAILGMLTGSASLRVPDSADDVAVRRYETTVIQAAVRGALREITTALEMIPR